MAAEDQALLSNRDGFTIFQFGKHTIRFRAPYSLERYTEIKEWGNGYLVVMAKYAHNPTPEEEYIDLIPILKDLFFDATAFLAPIKGVELSYVGSEIVAQDADHKDHNANNADDVERDDSCF